MKKIFLLFLLTVFISSLILASDYFVVGEVFKSTTCPYCPAAQAGLEDLYDQHVRVVPLVFYTGASIVSPGASERFGMYSMNGVPSAQFGGTSNVGGGMSSGSMYSYYLPRYNQLIGYNSPMVISMSFELNDNGMLEVKSTVEITGTFTETNNRLFTFVTLDGPGNPRFLVVRYNTQNFNMTNVGDIQTFTATFPYDTSWSLDELRAVSMVQTLGNPKRILQAQYTGFTGTVCEFTADIVQGPPSLTVNFRDTSVPLDGILSWAWDFDGDGVIDSEEQHPVWTYDEPGYYSVSLTITTNQDDEPVSITKNNFINVSNSEDIQGVVSGIWRSEFSPYIVTGDINIPENRSLIIEPGVTVKVENNSIVNVYGKILSQGQKYNEVIFTTDTEWKGVSVIASTHTAEFYNTVFEKANSAAIRSTMTEIYVEACTFTFNNSTNVGAAIDLSNCPSSVVKGSFFANNFSASNSGAINISASSLELHNSVLVNNTGRNAGAVFLRNSSNLNIVNSTIYNNENTHANGGSVMNSMSNAVIVNSIINGEVPVFNLNSSTEISYSCISAEVDGSNINVNPMFENPSEGIGYEFITQFEDWYLGSTSLCIDAGNPYNDFNDVENPDNIGFAMYPARGTIRNDIGAFGGAGGQNMVSVKDESIVLKPRFITVNAYPNPFNPNLNLSLYLKEKNTNVLVEIFNIRGQKVKEIFNDIPKSETLSLKWDGTNSSGQRLSSGIYFVKVQTNQGSVLNKVLMLK